MWSVIDIEEVDDDLVQRYPGEPSTSLVTIENENGSRCQFECADNWLKIQDIHVGDEWPEDVEAIETATARLNNMVEFMDNYYNLLEEMDINDDPNGSE